MRPENGGRAERLVHDAVALRQLQQLRDLLGGRSGIQLESEPDLTKADRRFLGDAERPAEVQIALGSDGAAPDRDRQARRDRPQRDAGASDQCFEEHVARARQASVTTRRRMETGGDQGPPRVTMLETFETAAVYHQGHERGLSAEQARPMIDSALRESAARAKAAIASLAASVAGRCRLERAALLAGSGRPLPPLEAVLRSHPLVHAAEGEMYRDAVGRACEALGLSLLRLPAKELHERAATTLGMKETALRARLAAMGKKAGRPWGSEQRECALAAWVAAVAT